ncbi:GtrA family protein [Vibrio neptunius]|uniref:GtrA family protein n=1 Tax=Vibrio neptunius TaxID=170651 RepID=A0ABS3A588_9VIBR|nr:GtrA family protein [Vibrio neptunius]MBN3515884.1 GtrA family protein [Vibrio neptunius]MBN3550091.1 GtrA family protein [Vibrio neptunius]MBN3578189.1 GtrA family protein [Vibrio neptunius]MCH9871853.1 GtrA family protein [Vibrio neptunius]
MLKKQIGRFILVGLLNTAVGYSLYALFIFSGFNYALSVLFSTILGVAFNFKTIGRFVFSNSNDGKIIRFLVVYGIVYLVNVTTIQCFLSMGLNSYMSGLIAIFPASIISFVLNKHYVFKERYHEVN